MYCAPSMHLISTDLAGYLLYGINPLCLELYCLEALEARALLEADTPVSCR